MSIRVIWYAWPMWSVPVTLGGGSWIENEGFASSKPALKYPRDSQSGYQRDSMSWGSKAFASSIASFYLPRLERLGDGVADRLSELLVELAERPRDRRLHLRHELLHEALLQLGAQAPFDFRHHAREHFLCELGGGGRSGFDRRIEEVGQHRHGLRVASRRMAAQQRVSLAQQVPVTRHA